MIVSYENIKNAINYNHFRSIPVIEKSNTL